MLALGRELVGLGRVADDLHVNCVRVRRQLRAVGELHDEATVGRLEEAVGRDARVERHTDAVAHAHLEQGLGIAAIARSAHRERLAALDEPLHDGEGLEQALHVRAPVLAVLGRVDADDAVAGPLELGRGGAGGLAHGHGEADEGGRDVELLALLLEAAAHRVLAADGTHAEVNLGHEGAEDGCGRLAPALGHVAQALEVLLEREVGVLVAKAGSHELGHALHHGEVGARELVLLHEVGVEAPGHGACRGGLAVDGELGHHGLARRELPAPAKRHEHRGRADCGVEALGEALVGGHVEVGDQRVHALAKACALPAGLPLALLLHVHVHVLGGAVAGKELAREVDDRVAVPLDADARLLGDGGDDRGLEVLLAGVGHELVDVGGGQGHGHALLALGDGELGAVEALVLLGDLVEVDVEAVGQLAHGHAHAAGAKVVAALDEAAGVTPAEEALELALDGGVALLHLGAALLEALDVLGLGAAGGAADAVAAGAAAEQHDLVAGGGALAAHVVGRGGAHDGAHLHAFGHVAGVVELAHLAGGEADLVAVAGVAGRRRGHELALRELARQRLRDGARGVGRAGDTHGLVDVAAPGERVADGTADAGGRAAERLDLGGVVVRLVLEEEEPVLVLAVHVNLHLYGAGVDLLGLVEVLELSGVFEPLGADGAHVHEADGLGVATELVAHLEVLLEGGLDHGVVDLHVIELGAEGGVTAVVGPVGVDDANLGDGRVAVLVGEVVLAELEVREIHGEATVHEEGLEAGVVELAEAVEHLDGLWLGHVHLERSLGGERRLARLDRVDDVVLDGGEVLVREVAFEHVDLGGAHVRAVAGAHELHALARGVGALVELSGQVLDGEDAGARRGCVHEVGGVQVQRGHGQLGGGHVDLRLAEHDGHAALEEFGVDALDVVAVDEAQAREFLDAKDGAQLS